MVQARQSEAGDPTAASEGNAASDATDANAASDGSRRLFAFSSQDTHKALTATALALGAGAVVLGVVGVPKANLHGPLHYLGVMCPFCGGTRGTVALMRGNLALAWRYNPGIVFLAAAAGLVVSRAAVGWLSGRWWDLPVHWPRRWYGWAFVAAAFAILWVNQQLNAAFLR